MSQTLLNCKFIYYKEDVKSFEDVFKIICDDLLLMNYVEVGYYEDLVNREKENPTGLKLKNLNVSLAHVDSEKICESVIAVMTTKNPVYFRNMVFKSEEIEVSLIVLLVLKDGVDHIETLKRIAILIKDQDFITSVVNSSNRNELLTLLTEKEC